MMAAFVRAHPGLKERSRVGSVRTGLHTIDPAPVV